MEFSEDILGRLEKLEEKYSSTGQDLASYMDGLLYANPLHYWDYTLVETLLSLQRPRTDFPDEVIFIMYHQITELYFKLSLHEIDQIANNGKIIAENGKDMGWNDQLDPTFFADRIRRINAYFEALTKSFDIMVHGMEKEQFLSFRMSLLPASGFQSAQYRMIEISCSDIINLTQKDMRDSLRDKSLEEQAEHFYWKEGSIEVETGKKTKMLQNFEEKYMRDFVKRANAFKDKNLWQKYKGLSEADQQNEEVIRQMKQLDQNVNVNWPLVHYKSAVRYLQQKEGDIAATGGTNWQKYLPPRFQKRIFFPDLWTEQEREQWGKAWVDEQLGQNNG